MSTRLILIVAACAALYVVGNDRVPLWDRDEPRYAQASRQMLQSGEWVVPQLLDKPRINKPPLIYWCQAASMSVLGDNATAARLPSAIAMTLTLCLLAVTVRRLIDEEHAFWAVLIFGTSGLVVMSAKMCLTDAVLLLFVTGAQVCLFEMWRGRATWAAVVGFAACTGLGLLTKGPVVLGVNGLTLAVLGVFRALDGWQHRRRGTGFQPVLAVPQEQNAPVLLPTVPHGQDARATLAILPLGTPWARVLAKVLVALAIVLAIALPWVVMMQRRMPEGLSNTVKKDIWKRILEPAEQHSGPPGFYLLFLLVTFFPWWLFLWPTAKFAWRERRDPLVRFAVAAVAGPWLMFEAIQTKLPHYVLPCFPFLALLTARAVVAAIRGTSADLTGRAFRAWAGLWSLLLIAMGAGPWAILWFFPALRSAGDLPYPAMTAVTLAAVALAVVVLVQFHRRRLAAAARWMAASAFALFALLYTLYLPNARFFHLSEDVGAYLRSIDATAPGQVYMIDYKEDSLPFYQGGTIRPQPKNTYLATDPPENWARYYVITREIWDATPPDAKAQLELRQSFQGWAYAAKGRVVEVLVVRKR